MNRQLTKTVLSHPIHFLAFGFGSGLFPRAPGTVGTLVAIIPYLFFSQLPLAAYLLILALSFALGIYLCEQSAKMLGVHDHGGIVWDEFVGFWITMLVAPEGWLWIVLGFFLFRLFDILKPFPINVLDKRLPGGLGIMVDDAVAGTFAWLILQIIAQMI
tara:strand:+ start:26334 stop:26810 length:477 start_codon:yes stop_codon:yes gene_type:complete